jgi:hypothetical protein
MENEQHLLTRREDNIEERPGSSDRVGKNDSGDDRSVLYAHLTLAPSQEETSPPEERFRHSRSEDNEIKATVDAPQAGGVEERGRKVARRWTPLAGGWTIAGSV